MMCACVLGVCVCVLILLAYGGCVFGWCVCSVGVCISWGVCMRAGSHGVPAFVFARSVFVCVCVGGELVCLCESGVLVCVWVVGVRVGERPF